MRDIEDIPAVDEYMVYVSCMTYNQKDYIEDALRGFVMQRTDFPYVCMVMDDASTDGEPAAILSFLEREFDMANSVSAENDETKTIVSKSLSNSNCTFVVQLLKENHFSARKSKRHLFRPWKEKSKYVALCEGDDYWIDPMKLQMQVNFLEAHPNISLSCCRYKVLDMIDQTTESIQNPYFESRYINCDWFTFTRDEAFGGTWITKTPTCLYRREASHPEFLSQFLYSRDVHLFYDILSSGDGVCHSFEGSVYRISGKGVFGGKAIIEQNRINYNVYAEFCHKIKDKILINKAYYFWDQLTNAGERPAVNNWLSFIFFMRNLYHRAINFIYSLKKDKR